MDPNDGQKLGANSERKWSLKSISKRLRSGGMKRANEIAVEENQNLPIFQLPHELLIKIIELVPIAQWASMELVSRRFQTIVNGLWENALEIRLDELVYKKEKKPHQIVEAVLKKLLLRSPNVASINGFAEFFDEYTPIRLETVQLLSKFQHLQMISFPRRNLSYISPANCAVFLESSASRKCWKSLDIGDGIIFNNGDGEQIRGPKRSLRELGRKINHQPIPSLESVKLTIHNLRIFDRFLRIDWSGLKKLVVVDSFFDEMNEALSIIRQCVQVSHLEIKIPVPEFVNENWQPSYSYGEFMQGVASLVNLSVLKISGFGFMDNDFHDALLMLIQGLACRGIVDLALVEFYCSDQIVDAVTDHLTQLRSLELEVGDCTNASLERLVNTMRQLESLKFQSHCGSNAVNGAVVRAIGGNMIHLKCLHLNNLAEISSEDLISLADLRKLKELRIEGWFWDFGIWTSLGFESCMEALKYLLTKFGISTEAMGVFLKKIKVGV